MPSVMLTQEVDVQFQHSSPNRISTFPLELLESIFKDCVEFGITQADDWAVPLTLSHVCHHWRDAVHNSPRLWTRIVMNGTPACKERTPFWFHNSGGCLLDVVVNARHLHYKAGRDILVEAFAIVASRAPRWRTFNMTFGIKSFGAVKQLCSQFNLTMERLETLRIGVPQGSEWWRFVKDMSFDNFFIEVAPCLRTVILVSCHPLVDPDAPPPWTTQVTHLELNKLHITWTYIFDILRSFPLLQKLVLDVSIPQANANMSPSPPHQMPVNLAHLCDLTVSYPTTGWFPNSPSCIGIFPYLLVPSLSTLLIKDLKSHGRHDWGCNMGSRPATFVADMLNAIVAKHPPLQSLSLDTVCIHDDGLIRSLAAAPFLEELFLARSPIQLSFLVENRAPLLPLLDTLTIRECDVSPATLAALIRPQSTSNNNNPSIQHLHIDHCRRIKSSDADTLRELGAGRLTVDWS